MIAVGLALAASTFVAPSPRLQFDFQSVAELFRKEHHLESVSPEDVDLHALLERDFFRTQVGLFDVWIPAGELAEGETAHDYRGVCAQLCVAQAHWLGWLEGTTVDGPGLEKAFEKHADWIAKWRISKLEEAADEGVQDTLDLFDAGPEERERSAALVTAMRSGAVLGYTQKTAAPVPLVLMPRRKGFVEFLAFAGWVRPAWSASFWVDGAVDWNEFRLEDLQVIALQYPAGGASSGDYTRSASMKDRAPTGLEEQVVQLAMNQLFARLHGDELPGPLVKALSINMIIELYGACHTRLDGDLGSRSASARGGFVRGGKSSGGTLQMNVAESRWRTDFGKYHYLKILKQVQKSGAAADKRNKNRYASFLLIGDSEGARSIVHPPLLDASNPPKDPPAPVLGDFQELYRAYRTAFVFWLQTAAVGSKRKSQSAFCELMARLSGQLEDAAEGEAGGDENGTGGAREAAATSRASFPELVEEVYGVSLTDPELSLDSLEGQFLKWLSRQ